MPCGLYDLKFILNGKTNRIIATCLCATIRVGENKCVMVNCPNHNLFNRPYNPSPVNRLWMDKKEYEDMQMESNKYPCTFLCILKDIEIDLIKESVNKWALLNILSDHYHRKEIANIIVKKLYKDITYEEETHTKE
jgi:hypothetical protein